MRTSRAFLLSIGSEEKGLAEPVAKLWPSRLANDPSERQKALNEAIHELPTQEREITEMRMSGHPTEEIAALKGIAPGTVRAALSHVYEKLRRTLRE